MREGYRVTMGGEVCGAAEGHTRSEAGHQGSELVSVSAATGCSHVKL